jgi:hypothetical protein
MDTDAATPPEPIAVTLRVPPVVRQPDDDAQASAPCVAQTVAPQSEAAPSSKKKTKPKRPVCGHEKCKHKNVLMDCPCGEIFCINHIAAHGCARQSSTGSKEDLRLKLVKAVPDKMPDRIV